MSMAMSRSERETFLAGVHVAIVAIEEPGRGPLAVPIWYGYEPGGELWFVTDRDSRKGRLLEKAGRVRLVAQTETPPYRYASVEGPIVAIEPSDLERHRRPLAHRYLGRELGEQYISATDGEAAGSIVVRIRPEHWLTVDYGKRFAT
jgi:nitroimidazol reductase NimA-like FMN-containing flavoprotein (pyridoxamine 5'-phosphate oxidase superfamily)